MVYLLNRTMTPTEFDETKEKVEALIAAGEVDLEEVKPEFVREMMLLDLLVRTTMVSGLCVVLWNMIS